MKERGQLSNRLTSAYRFLYIFYKFDKDNDLSLLDPPEAQVQTPLVSLVMNLESLRPEDIGNYIGTKGVHIKRLLREKKGSKITMEKDDGHVKIQIEALKEDLQEIKDRLLQRETLVVQARRQHEESVSLRNFHMQILILFNLEMVDLVWFMLLSATFKKFSATCYDVYPILWRSVLLME